MMKITLEGRYCRLEPYDTKRHSEALYQALCYPPAGDNIWEYLPQGPFDDLADFTRYMGELFDRSDSCGFVVYKLHEEEPSGLCGLFDIDQKNKTLELGAVVFSPELQKTREATEALHLVIQHSFNLGYRRCSWKCNALNENSKHAAQRLGFVYEGTMRNHRIEKGKNRNTAWLSIIEEDWPDILTAHQKWLTVDNFDEEGEQRARLQDF